MTINIPRLEKANEATQYTRIVQVEGVKDLKSLIYPTPTQTESDELYQNYLFKGHGNDSLTLLFGDSVTYRLNLVYELKNKDLQVAQSELALPPDTDYQKILLNHLDPQPESITTDEDGNWLARYNLTPQQRLVVTAELYATVYPIPSLPDPSTTSFQKANNSKYWGIHSATVDDLATKLKSPENIYRYLVDNLTYNYSALAQSRRRGAIVALTEPGNALCTEFTDSFIAIARSLNIPSREINGYGYTSNSVLFPQNQNADILHAWPEFYDQEKAVWTAIDPTWGHTTGGLDYFNKLDFSHIAFVRHGKEDSYPLPAGAYKNSPSDKHIQVEVASDTPKEVFSSQVRDGYLYNTGNVALRDDRLGYLPPYGKAKIEPSTPRSLYDKIKAICVNLLSRFLRLPLPST